MPVLDLISPRLGQITAAVRSGALTQGAFPWERRKMSEREVTEEFGALGREVFQKYRQASEKGTLALERIRRQSLDTFAPLSEASCRMLNKKLESGEIIFGDIVEQRGAHGAEAIQAYRERHFYEAAEIDGKGYRAPLAHEFPQFEARSKKDGIYYFLRGQSGMLNKASFVDKGDKIEIAEGKSRAAVEAALELAAQKWNGQLHVAGTDKYKALCVKIAAERNWELTNPELKEQLAAAKANLAKHPPEPPSVGRANSVTPNTQSVAPTAVEQPNSNVVVAPPLVEPTQAVELANAPMNNLNAQDLPKTRPVLKSKTQQLTR